jgi:hypothetical protein
MVRFFFFDNYNGKIDWPGTEMFNEYQAVYFNLLVITNVCIIINECLSM